MSGNREPLLAVTMGEPAGIGPELIARAWRRRAELGVPSFIYFGSVQALEAVDASLPVTLIDPQVSNIPPARKDFLAVDIPLADSLSIGTLNSKNGAAVIKAIQCATKAALDGLVDAVVTAPIHKASLYEAGFDTPGHTEYLARLCGLPDNHSVMMLATDGLRVVPVTAHIPLAKVASSLTADKIIHAGMVTARDLHNKFGIAKPRIAVAGLNPHAGEGGTIGMEEATHIMPAIWALRDEGIDVSDPQPADTLFHEEARATFDAVLCMYHDQALIPLKTLDFWGGVNVTLGLPIIRTSPDHGTALSLAGTGKARIDSLAAAMKTASAMALKQVAK